MARELGVSKATVQRVWSENEIKPHLTRVFKLSSDPDFEAKFWDVIGLYLNPPERRNARSRLFSAANREPPLGRNSLFYQFPTLDLH